MADEKVRDMKLHVARGADAWAMLWRARAARDCQHGVGSILDSIPLIVQALAPTVAPPTTRITTEDVRRTL